MASETSRKALDCQQTIMTATAKEMSNFAKDSQSRKTIVYFQYRWEKLQQNEALFKQNNQVIIDSSDVLDTHDYFIKNIFKEGLILFEKYRKALTENAIKLFPGKDIFQIDEEEKQSSSSGRIENIKTMLKSFDRAIDEFNVLTPEEKTNARLKTTFERLKQKWIMISRLHEYLTINNGAYNATEYYGMEQKMQPLVLELGDFDIVIPTVQANNQNVNPNILDNVKLPKITLPKFDGDYTKWVQFEELFQEMIGNKSISGTQKLMYLKQNVYGEASRLVAHLQLSDANYEVAWNALVARYKNQRLIIAALLEKFINIDNIKIESASHLKILHDTAIESLNAIETFRINPEDMVSVILHHILLKKLDSTSHTLYEQSLQDNKSTQRIDNLLTFLEKRFQTLEAVGKKVGVIHSNSPKNNKTLKPTMATALISTSKEPTMKLCDCKESHPIYKCPSFLASTPDDRYKLIKAKKRCINCFKEGHVAKECTSRKCKNCDKKHNSLLHFENQNSLVSVALLANINTHVFLATAIIQVKDKYGTLVNIRALLDSGSQINMMTESAHKKLGVTHSKSVLQISGIGNSNIQANKRSMLQIHSLHSNFTSELEVYVVKNVTSCQPKQHIDIRKWNLDNNIQLADEAFNIPSQIDLIIGGEMFYRLLTPGFKSLGNGLPDLQNTVFGWVVIGKLLGLKLDESFVGISIKEEATLDQQLSRFWEVEEKYQPHREITEAERACEQQFEATTKRDACGRFIVNLQFLRDPMLLGTSEDMAIRRFFYLEKRFAKDGQLKSEYTKFMDEYESLGHMEEIQRDDLEGKHYIIPHHFVLNPGSSTTKFRVVFDASAKTTNGLSLNQILAKGHVLQDDLFSILVRFRKHTYVFSADIGKMYRQILVNPKERNWQVIVWRANPQDKLKYYKLKTLTYGITCSSFLSIKTLQHLATIEREKYPLASVVSKRDFNVDDIMTGSDDLNEALQIQQQLINMLQLGQMELHKWCSNNKLLLANIPAAKRQISLEVTAGKEETKALGVKWIPSSDTFKIHYDQREHKNITKRTILAETAQLFDPLGLVNPVIVKAKIFMQELWIKKINWDEPIPHELQHKWTKFRKELLALNEASIPRHMIISSAKNIELHLFSDSSVRAYGAVAYIRSVDIQGNIKNELICSKSRVAPVVSVTLPRLELCGAVIMVELANKLKEALDINFHAITYWTDSEIVLSWLSSEKIFKTFVANRIAKIKRNSNISDWRHIPTKLNPADLISRGVASEKLLSSSLWWHGPEFLTKHSTEWPESKPAFVREEAEEKPIKTILMTSEYWDILDRISHRNSIRTLQRIIAFCLKFRRNKGISNDHHNNNSILSVAELKKALTVIIKIRQQKYFHSDIKLIKAGKPERTQFSNLAPILDENGVLRVGGRLKASSLLFDQKQPILLAKDDKITRLILERIHIENMHVGAQALLAITRQKYWPLNGKRLAQSVVHQCVLCVRSKPKILAQIMGDLPVERVTASRPFLCVGVDYAGPIMIHYKLRGKHPTKSYMCLFVCFTTKAVHLEASSDSSTEAFVRCLKRFIARRGVPSKIFSDNAKNFVGCKNQLSELKALWQNPQHLQTVEQYCLNHSIEWKPIPPRSPHFGGLWESAIKSAKHHLVKVLNSETLTFEELSTVLTEIEAILNSRPLTPLSSDPNDLQPLTPGHFLIGSALNCINEDVVPPLSKWKEWTKLRKLKNLFWTRWKKEYLGELQSRVKWNKVQPNIEVGALVTLKEDNIPPLKWQMGRIVSVTPDKDGRIRVVQVRTHTGVYKRAIHELCLLPVETSSDVEHPIENYRDSQNGKQRKQELSVDAPIFQPRTSKGKNLLYPKNLSTDKCTIQEKSIHEGDRKQSSIRGKGSDGQEIASRSGRRIKPPVRLSTMTLLILTFMALVWSTMGSRCNLKPLNTNPGLYFEHIGELTLTNDNWKIICYFNMNSYWKEEPILVDLFHQLKENCPVSHPLSYCNVTMQQLSHQMSSISSKNQLIYGFSHKSRRRRGAINIVGNGFHMLFGLMDADDAKHYDDEIFKLKEDNAYAMNLLRNQTSIQDLTQNIIRHDEEIINKQMEFIQKAISELHEKLGKINVFNSLYFQFFTLLQGYREMQNDIIDLLTKVYSGKLPTDIIAPTQLLEQIIHISNHLQPNLMVPGGPTKDKITQLYSILEAKASVTKDHLIIKINIPLVNREFFKLYHIIPVPFIKDNKLQSIVPSTKYLALNLKQDHFYVLTDKLKDQCKVLENNSLICKQTQPLHSIQPNKSHCEITIMLHPEAAHDRCLVTKTNKQQIWTALRTENNFLFSFVRRAFISIICGSGPHSTTTQCEINGAGIITLEQKCMIKSGTIEITAKNTISTSREPALLTPIVNISDSTMDFNNHMVNLDEFKINPQLDILRDAIRLQRDSEETRKVDVHHIHHYVAIYFCIIIILVLIIVILFRKRLKKIFLINKSQRELTQNVPIDKIQDESRRISLES